MLGARARTLLLATVGGAVDATSFVLLFGMFTAHLSGDTTHLAVDVGVGEFGADALGRIVVLVTFMLGLGLGVALVALSAGRTVRIGALEIGLLAAAMVIGAAADDAGTVGRGSALFVVLIGMLALAMGLQSGFLRRVAGTSVHTTFVTGMLTSMAEDAVAAWRDRDDVEARRRVRLHGGIWVGYLVGGICGAALALAWGYWALVLPIAALGIVLTGGGVRQEPTPR
jgi:uncharacterized membrane protein YoaK (UPF0700 family)